MKRNKRRKTQEARAMAMAEVDEVVRELEAPNSGDKEPESELLLMHNLVRSYVSAIIELWTHQVS